MRMNGLNDGNEIDNWTNNSPHQLHAEMEEGVDIQGLDDSLHYNDNSYSFDSTHPNAVPEINTTSPSSDSGGLKRSLETNDDPIALKRLKTTEVGKSIAMVSTNKQWDAMFERLVAFKQRNGHCLVPKRYSEDPKLGTWVETQRVQYKRLQREYDETSGTEAVQPNKRLNEDRLRKLQEIGFVWSAKNVRKQRNNSEQTMPPPIMGNTQSSPTPGGANDLPTLFLGLPAEPSPASLLPNSNTRATIPTANKPRKFEPRQGGRLNDQQWEEMYQRLVRYKAEHGDCLVPRKYEKDPKLSTWVETQRFLWNRDYRKTVADSAVKENNDQDYHLSSSTMRGSSFERASVLPDSSHIPVSTWQPVGDFDHEDDAAVVAAAAAAAAEAVDEEVGGYGSGTTDTATNARLTENEPPPQPKRLTKERKEKLDAIGFVWSLRTKRIEDHWDEMFRQLIEYKEQHGDCLVPSRYEANLKLGKWVETQRYEYTKLKRVEANPARTHTEIQDESLFKAKHRATSPRLTEERLRRLEAIGFEWKVRNKMKRYYDKQWQDMFDQLLHFKEKNGHTMVPKRYPENPRLANWVHTQRIQYRKLLSGGRKENPEKDGQKLLSEDIEGGVSTGGEIKLSKEDDFSFRLTEDRRRKLEEIGFVWSVRESDTKTDQSRMSRNSYDDLWDAMYERLKAYSAKHGNCLVPKRSKEDPKLGTWVDTQRVQYKKMKKKLAEQGVPFDEQKPSPEEIQEAKAQNKPVVGRLTEDRIRRLNELGFVWSLRDDWTKHYEELKDFKKEHGHCNVPARYTKNRKLGIWVSAQRQQYKQMQSVSQRDTCTRLTPLTQERIKLLNDLGFTWTIRSRDSLGESWNQRLQELREYKAVHGNCLVPSRYPPNPELGIWVGTQRTQYRLLIKARESGQKLPGSSGMNEERIQQLEELGFVWALRGQEGGRRDGKDESGLRDSEQPLNYPLTNDLLAEESSTQTQTQCHDNPDDNVGEPTGAAQCDLHEV